jgi:glycosyltransferase involved in cell wall biosynthesis
MTFKLTFVINHAAFFVSHRLPIALHARQNGNEVSLITGQAGSANMEVDAERTLERQQIRHERVAFRASSVNPLLELRGLWQLARLLRTERPDVVHCASPKGVLYGGIVARCTGVPALVLAVSGMGYAFTESGTDKLARRAVSAIYRLLARIAFGHPNKRVIVQNDTDRQFLIASGLAAASQITLIPGSGVDLARFEDMSPDAKQKMGLLPARMLIDKGVTEFADAARRLRNLAPGWRFVLAGAADYQNPSSIPRAEIEAWQREGIIEWLGHVEDMLPLYREAAIVCLPSYREGMPKSLLEAAAAGCAVLTTDTTGCREAIIAGETGDLVAVRDTQALADALLALIEDKERREGYGRAGKMMAGRRFSIGSVIEDTLTIYSDLLQGRKSRARQ